MHLFINKINRDYLTYFLQFYTFAVVTCSEHALFTSRTKNGRVICTLSILHPN